MRMTSADVMAWQIVAEVLPGIAPEEVDFLPELVETVHEAPPAIGAKPGAFNGAEISAAAIVVYGVAVQALKFAAPKLFDAILDVGKDAMKSFLKQKKAGVPATDGAATTAHAGIDAASAMRVRQLILDAGKKNRLSAATCERIADAVAVHILSGTATGGAPREGA